MIRGKTEICIHSLQTGTGSHVNLKYLIAPKGCKKISGWLNLGLNHYHQRFKGALIFWDENLKMSEAN